MSSQLNVNKKHLAKSLGASESSAACQWCSLPLRLHERRQGSARAYRLHVHANVAR